nr:hypothetical protein [Tanacetum cinerariifolium]
CALLRKKFKEDLFTYCIENRILQDAFEPSNNNANVVNALQEPFVVKQDPGQNSSQSPPQINHHCCYGYGDWLEDIFCHQCTCEFYGKGAHYGYNYLLKVLIILNPEPYKNQTIDELPQTMPSFDPTCFSEDGNLFTYDSLSNIVHDFPNVFDPPPQPPLYSSEFCGNDARVLMKPTNLMEQLTSMCDMVGQYIQKKEEEKQIEEEQAAKARYWKIPVCYDDDDDEDYTIAITSKEPDNSVNGIFCQQCTCKSCGKGAHIGYNCPPKVPITSNPEPCNQTMNNELPQTLPSFDSTCYSDKENSVPCVSKPNFVDESSNIFNPPPQPFIYSYEFCGSNAQYGHYCTPQVPFINPELGYSQDFNFPQDIHDFQQQYLCCDQCGGPHETFQCQQVIFY